ncbi:hypothetical protein SCLCIDRAFT_498830 [Scleroderma citrinum Foug A]|uniref:Uncharacterized protein n=1 Tax=Scleroderma citrinum Foug A TaxID=1036808 RepID=A0A0C3EQA4_9AGAM|nr:hypothetical protein SCLCIDRAFT_498830 [Scleroderma citrinum Foug A]
MKPVRNVRTHRFSADHIIILVRSNSEIMMLVRALCGGAWPGTFHSITNETLRSLNLTLLTHINHPMGGSIQLQTALILLEPPIR